MRIALIVLALLAAHVAQAAPKPKKQNAAAVVQAEALAEHARGLFKEGYYTEAAAKYLEAYVALRAVGDERPKMLFNAGRAFQEAKRGADALVQFRAVIRHELSDGPMRADALKKIDELEKAARAVDQTDRPPIVELGGQPTRITDAQESQMIPRDLIVTGPGPTIKKPLPHHEISLVKGGATLTLGAAALGTWAFAYSQAEAARAIVPREEADITQFNELRSSAQAWQIVAIGCGVAGSALAVWTAADWWLTPVIAPPVRDGDGPAVVGARVGATF